MHCQKGTLELWSGLAKPQVDHAASFHIPETAPWLDEYLHELTVFPKGKHEREKPLQPPDVEL